MNLIRRTIESVSLEIDGFHLRRKKNVELPVQNLKMNGPVMIFQYILTMRVFSQNKKMLTEKMLTEKMLTEKMLTEKMLTEKMLTEKMLTGIEKVI
jgi:hypothetical protein